MTKRYGVGWGILLAAVTNICLVTQTTHADLYAHFPLDDGDGFEARNLAPGGEAGYIFDWDIGGLGDDGSVWVDDPNRGTVMGFDGSSAWVEAGFLPIMDLENQFSWAFWSRIPPEQPSPNNDIVLGNRWGESGSDTSPREFIKFTTNRFEYHMNGGFGDDLAYADSDLPLDQWVYNSVVKDGDQLSYYRNGELRTTTPISGGQTTEDPFPIGFGADVGASGGQAWRGSLSDVQMYTSALTPAQISTAMGGDVVGDADLYAHYPMNEGGDVDFLTGSGPGAIEALIFNLDSGLGEDGNVWAEDAERGTVLTFAGSYVDAGELPIMDMENDFTWNFWSKSDSGQTATSNTVIIGNRFDFDGASTGEWIRFTNNRIEYRADGSRDSYLEWGEAGPDDIRMVNDDEWYHHAVVKDGDTMTYYRDGSSKNSITLGLGQQSPDPLPFALGGQAAPDTPGGETFIGYLSDVRLYDNALTPAEVAELAGVVVEVPGDCTGDGMITTDDMACMTADTRDLVLDTLNLVVGDLDGSGEVDFADFLSLSGNFGGEGGNYTTGDIDINGEVNFPDFLTLSGNFGAKSDVAGVPEPTSAFMLTLGMLCLGMVRRRQLQG